MNLLFCFIGALVGTLVGVLPGLGPVGAVAFLLSITFKMEPASAIIMLAGIYYGAMYGGSTTSILVNIPGETASVVTCLDGYKMARQGRAGAALGISAFGSFIAGTVGVVGLMFLAPLLGRAALSFGPPEYFALTLTGLTLVAYLSQGSMIKALIMAVLGLLAGTVGMDPISGEERFTYGTLTLRDGFGLVPVAMGLFGIAEVLENLVVLGKQSVYETKIQGLLPNRQDWRDSAAPIARGSVLGFFLGILPGPGPVIASFVSYAMEKRLSRYPEKFGTGVIEGVAGPEAANNAATAGSFIPLLSLGIPTSAIMALFMGALMIHGIQPGPLFIAKYPELFWGFIASMYVGNAMLLVLEFAADRHLGAVVKNALRDSLPINITFLLDRRLQPQRQRRRDRHHARLRGRRLRPAPGRLRRRAVHPRHGARADHGDIFAPDAVNFARQFLHFSHPADLRRADGPDGGVFDLADIQAEEKETLNHKGLARHRRNRRR